MAYVIQRFKTNPQQPDANYIAGQFKVLGENAVGAYLFGPNEDNKDTLGILYALVASPEELRLFSTSEYARLKNDPNAINGQKPNRVVTLHVGGPGGVGIVNTLDEDKELTVEDVVNLWTNPREDWVLSGNPGSIGFVTTEQIEQLISPAARYSTIRAINAHLSRPQIAGRQYTEGQKKKMLGLVTALYDGLFHLGELREMRPRHIG